MFLIQDCYVTFYGQILSKRFQVGEIMIEELAIFLDQT
jgi:hypothetical protein